MEVARLWRTQLQRYRLVGERAACGEIIMPPRDVCTGCGKNLGQLNPNEGLELVRKLDAEAKTRPPVVGAEDYWLNFLAGVIARNGIPNRE